MTIIFMQALGAWVDMRLVVTYSSMLAAAKGYLQYLLQAT